MKLFRRNKKDASAAPVVEKPKTPYKESNEFIQRAKDFEKSEIDNVKKREKIAWFVTGAFGLITLAAVFAVAAMQPLVRTENNVVLVDMKTGQTTVITTLDHKTISNNKELNKLQLENYVKDREGYDWYTIQDTYNATMAKSSKQEQERFNKPFADGVGPDKVLEQKYRVKVDVQSVSFVGETAQVRFTKTKLPVSPVSGEQPVTQNMIASIAFHYDNPPVKENERGYNRIGFFADSYQVEAENTQ